MCNVAVIKLGSQGPCTSASAATWPPVSEGPGEHAGQLHARVLREDGGAGGVAGRDPAEELRISRSHRVKPASSRGGTRGDHAG